MLNSHFWASGWCPPWDWPSQSSSCTHHPPPVIYIYTYIYIICSNYKPNRNKFLNKINSPGCRFCYLLIYTICILSFYPRPHFINKIQFILLAWPCSCALATVSSHFNPYLPTKRFILFSKYRCIRMALDTSRWLFFIHL